MSRKYDTPEERKAAQQAATERYRERRRERLRLAREGKGFKAKQTSESLKYKMASEARKRAIETKTAVFADNLPSGAIGYDETGLPIYDEKDPAFEAWLASIGRAISEWDDHRYCPKEDSNHLIVPNPELLDVLPDQSYSNLTLQFKPTAAQMERARKVMKPGGQITIAPAPQKKRNDPRRRRPSRADDRALQRQREFIKIEEGLEPSSPEIRKQFGASA